MSLFERYLTVWVALCILAGVALGHPPCLDQALESYLVRTVNDQDDVISALKTLFNQQRRVMNDYGIVRSRLLLGARSGSDARQHDRVEIGKRVGVVKNNVGQTLSVERAIG